MGVRKRLVVGLGWPAVRHRTTSGNQLDKEVDWKRKKGGQGNPPKAKTGGADGK